ncbi:type II methionyl aminopeptidase [Candidatus Woesearchaeota archaeon]|jgi:methionyl aminopeptidase|nr:type II methionyl aminopeptidase [Candidatus Woesearchaeota archaeon]MBT5397275.1 type II methionyl aminopeptidase [Candidatus Woesearchaeota archaeon]MBT5924492.1 type II methionyl aminopeptidase [Candidatus Woesearchaeota archaeon]MBT6367179.1 type II methionyl aminopeptidase [Candidatus Woesearchaeota archaeon]MBT7762675.1 type II methionyl aminopeptidase [Candidatus Woesearchaeota archaeon]
MDLETIQKYSKAGEIAATALQYGKSLIKNGAKVIEILDAVETKIEDMGGKPAFPAQISLNECAAHSCSSMDDDTILRDHVVKLDVGVHIDGYIADNALTVDLSGKYTDLVNASRDALNEALKIIKPGITLAEIGNVIHKTITSAGFSPVRNLSGHGLGHYNIHTKPSVPNFDNGNKNTLEDGDVIAIEPFASMGAGIVQESVPATVFTLMKDTGVRDPITRKVLQEIKKYNGLPFAKRWLERTFGTPRTNLALRTLVRMDCIQEHNPLVDQSRGMVSQAEHSVIVQGKPLVYTRIE